MHQSHGFDAFALSPSELPPKTPRRSACSSSRLSALSVGHFKRHALPPPQSTLRESSQETWQCFYTSDSPHKLTCFLESGRAGSCRESAFVFASNVSFGRIFLERFRVICGSFWDSQSCRLALKSTAKELVMATLPLRVTELWSLRPPFKACTRATTAPRGGSQPWESTKYSLH